MAEKKRQVLASAVIEIISISGFVSWFGILIVITSSPIRLQTSAITAAIKKIS